MTLRDEGVLIMSLSNFLAARPSREVGTVSIRVDFGSRFGSERRT